MLKKGIALLLSALLIALMLPVGAMAADNELELAEATETALREAVAAVEADSAKDTIVFAQGSETITLEKPLVIQKNVTIVLAGQTITASFETGETLPTLTVFTVEKGAGLTVKGEGTVKAAALPESSEKTATPYAFVLAEGTEAGGSLSLEGKVAVSAQGDSAYLIGMGTKSVLSLKTEGSLSGGSTAVRALSGATGYKVSVDMKGEISSPVALFLSDSPTVELKNAVLKGSLTWYGGEAQTPAPALSALTAEGSYPFVNGAAVSEEEFAAAADKDKRYTFSPYFTVSYTDGLDPESTLHTDKVAAGSAAPAYETVPTREGYDFLGWAPEAPTAASEDVVCKAQWAELFAVTKNLENITAEGGDTARAGADYSLTLTAAEGYALPESVSVTYTANGNEVPDCSFADGVLTVPGESVNAPFTVAAQGVEAAPESFAVTLPSGEGYTAAPTEGSESPVTAGGSYSFTVTIAEGYRAGEGFAVTANETALTADENGVYTISDIQAEQTVAVTGVELIPVTHTVTYTDGQGNVLHTDTVNHGEAAPAYSEIPTMEDKTFVRWDPELPETITEDITLTAVWSVNTYNVTLPTDNAYTITAEAGSQSPVEAGGSFSFRVNVNNGYAKTDDFAVKANDTVLAATNGVYTISQIRADQTVSVTGIVAVPTITSPAPLRTSASEATFYFTSSQAGTFYYAVTDTAAAVPTVANLVSQGKSDRCEANTMKVVTVSDLGSSAAKYIYILVENDAGVRSSTYRINLPAYGSTAVTYSVTLANGTGYTLSPAAGSQSPVTAGSSFSFTVNLQNGYQKGSGFAVKANGAALTADANGVYTITNIQSAQTVTVEGVEQTPVTYTVTLRNGTGYSINAVSGSKSPVAAGGSFSFTVTVFNGYQRGNGFSVKANNVALSLYNGVYTISNINADQVVTVSGVIGAGGGGGVAVTAPSITTTTLASATLGNAYSQQLSATGSAPITWTYTGTLPDGITLGSTTGLLSGTPTAEGTFRFAVKASNSRGTATRQMTLVVAGVSYTVTDGNNGQWTQGSKEGLTFKGSGSESFTVQIDGSRVDEKYLVFSPDKTSVTVSGEYLETLATGSHNLTLVYKNGSAKGKFNIRADAKKAAPAITAQPLSGEVKEGDSVTFNVTASGTAPMTYQWQVDKGDGKGYKDVAGGSSASLTVKNITAGQNGWKYRCVVTNASGRAESSAATLTVRNALGTVTTASPSPTETETPTRRSPVKAILWTALGLVVLGLAGFGGYRIYQNRKYDE